MNVKTIQIADKPTLDKINAMLKNSPDSIVGGGVFFHNTNCY